MKASFPEYPLSRGPDQQGRGDKPVLRHIIFEYRAVNTIDALVLESLEAINQRLRDSGIPFHLPEVNGPITAHLKQSHFLAELTGKVPCLNTVPCPASNPIWRGRRSTPKGKRTPKGEAKKEAKTGI